MVEGQPDRLLCGPCIHHLRKWCGSVAWHRLDVLQCAYKIIFTKKKNNCLMIVAQRLI